MVSSKSRSEALLVQIWPELTKKRQRGPHIEPVTSTSFFGVMIQTGDDRPALCAAADRAGCMRLLPWRYASKDNLMICVFRCQVSPPPPPSPPNPSSSSSRHCCGNLLISVSCFSLPFRDTTKSHYVCHGLCVQAMHLLEEEREKKDQRCSYNHL